MWELNYKENWVPKNWRSWTVVLEKTLESPLDCKEIQPVHPKRRSVLSVHWKDWCWSWNSHTLATWCEELTHFKRPWCWERSRAGGEGDDRGWDGWMAPLTQWAWVWVNSGSWWWTGRPGVLRFMGSQRVGHDWATELNWLWWANLITYVIKPREPFFSCSQREIWWWGRIREEWCKKDLTSRYRWRRGPWAKEYGSIQKLKDSPLGLPERNVHTLILVPVGLLTSSTVKQLTYYILCC